MTNKKKISFVFSFRNEIDNLKELVLRLKKSLKKVHYNLEIIFVNDSSDDGSLSLLKKIKKIEKNMNIKIITTTRPFGNSQCILTGFEHATGDVLIYFDTDLQDPPEIIPEMLEQWEKGKKIVHTLRVKRDNETKIKIVLSNIGYKLINYISNFHVPQNAGDFKLIDRHIVDLILKNKDRNPYLRGLIPWTGFESSIVKYSRKKRYKGVSKYPLLKSINPYNEFLKGTLLYSSNIPVILLLINFLFFLALLINLLFDFNFKNFLDFSFYSLVLNYLLILIFRSYHSEKFVPSSYVIKAID